MRTSYEGEAMTIIEAGRQMQAGKKVRRPIWQDGATLELHPVYYLLRFQDWCPEGMFWQPSVGDLTADDWVLAHGQEQSSKVG